MKKDQIITKKEVMHLWGIKMPTLMFLEHAAGFSPQSKEQGYTAEELRLLRNTLKNLTRNYMSK